MLHQDGTLETLRTFTYEDYRNRMDWKILCKGIMLEFNTSE
jgi:hypothetical protein